MSDIITTAHIMVTSLCDRNCKYCCNKQYNLNDIPYITTKELRQMKHIYLTGGEPFQYSSPDSIAALLKQEYPNIESVVVYTNAKELAMYRYRHGDVKHLDGVTISIKNHEDAALFKLLIIEDAEICALPNNRLYVFPGFEYVECPDSFHKTPRVWQEKFVPAPNCIFRRL